MAWIKVHQIGDYSRLWSGETFFVSAYDAVAKKVFRSSLGTRDFSTALSAVQDLAERLAEARMGRVRC